MSVYTYEYRELALELDTDSVPLYIQACCKNIYSLFLSHVKSNGMGQKDKRI